MPEKPITQKVIKIIKTVDKVVQEVEKGIGQTIAGINDLKQSRKKPEDDKGK